MKKGMKIVSILMIIGGLLTIAVGIGTIGLFMVSGDTSDETHALIFLAFIFGIANGLLEFVGGALGVRAANNPAKATDAVVFGFVTLVVGVCSLVLDFGADKIFASVMPLIYFICAVQLRRSAKES